MKVFLGRAAPGDAGVGSRLHREGGMAGGGMSESRKKSGGWELQTCFYVA